MSRKEKKFWDDFVDSFDLDEIEISSYDDDYNSIMEKFSCDDDEY